MCTTCVRLKILELLTSWFLLRSAIAASTCVLLTPSSPPILTLLFSICRKVVKKGRYHHVLANSRNENLTPTRSVSPGLPLLASPDGGAHPLAHTPLSKTTSLPNLTSLPLPPFHPRQKRLSNLILKVLFLLVLCHQTLDEPTDIIHPPPHPPATPASVEIAALVLRPSRCRQSAHWLRYLWLKTTAPQASKLWNQKVIVTYPALIPETSQSSSCVTSCSSSYFVD